MKKITADKDRKETYNEGEELWFELLKRLYEFVDELEKKDPKEIDEVNKKTIQTTLQKGIEDLLKKMCEYVSIQNLVNNVTENQERAQYKEFKNILESMLRSNTSFDPVLHSFMAILKDSIEKSESKRKKVTSKGNSYKKKIKNEKDNRIILNERDDEYNCIISAKFAEKIKLKIEINMKMRKKILKMLKRIKMKMKRQLN